MCVYIWTIACKNIKKSHVQKSWSTEIGALFSGKPPWQYVHHRCVPSLVVALPPPCWSWCSPGYVHSAPWAPWGWASARPPASWTTDGVALASRAAVQRFWLQMVQETILSFFFCWRDKVGWGMWRNLYICTKFLLGVLDLRDFFFYQGFVSLLELITKVDYHYLESDV